MDEIERRVRADIAEHGWHVGLVPADDSGPAWAFSIGLLERFGHPEVAVFGLDLETGHRLVNQIGLRVRQGDRFEAGESHAGLLEGLGCAFRTVAERWLPVFFGNVTWHYQRDHVPVLQCFWPDAGGRHPWDRDFDPAWRALQPRLYEQDPERAFEPTLAQALREEGAL